MWTFVKVTFGVTLCWGARARGLAGTALGGVSWMRRTWVKLMVSTGVPSMADGDVKIADDDDAIVAYLQRTYA